MAGFTPLIKKLKQNGTLVTFESAGEDLSLTSLGANNSKVFEFSKYALLKIPAIETPVNSANTIQFAAIEGAFVHGLSPSGPPPEGDRVDLAQSLQNYMLNLETLLIRSDDFNPNITQSPAERIFFKWLKEIGAIRYRAAEVGEKVATITSPIFVEEDDNDNPSTADIYDKVVVFIGEIEMVGNQRYQANSYRQLYFMVSTEEGQTPVVMFKAVADDNYYPGQVFRQVGNANIQYIQGSNANDDPTPAGLTAIAFYDQELPFGDLAYTMNGNPNDTWFKYNAPNGPDTYFTDAVFTDPTNDLITRTQGPNTITYKRSRLDGVQIDWTKTDYQAFTDNNYASFHDYNRSVNAGDFEFNAILLYYDLYDKATPDVRTTNLYGIIFLDDLINLSTAGGQIQTLPKVKPDPVTQRQGNAYGITLNLRHDVNSDAATAEVDISVNEYNTFSMVLFLQALGQMSLTNMNFEKLIIQLNDALNQIQTLEGLILNQESATALQESIASIQSRLVDIQAGQGVLDLLNSLQKQVSDILSGNSTVNLSFVTNFIGLDGIKIEAAAGGNYYIKNLRQRYDIINRQTLDTSGRPGLRNVSKLGLWDTLILHTNGGQIKTADGNITIYIDDTNAWQQNQVLEIKFEDPIDFKNFGLIFYSDSKNKLLNAAPYEALMGTITSLPSQKPTITIICLDPANYVFSILVNP